MITSPTVARFPSASGTSRSGGVWPRRCSRARRLRSVDEVAGGGEHDRVESGRSVGNPSFERILGRAGKVTDMHTTLIEIERQGVPVAVAEGKGCFGFGRVGEAVQLGQVEGAVNMFDVAKDAAGADRGELLIITNQPDTRPTAESETDGGVEGQSVGHPSFVDDQQRRRSDRGGPVRQLPVPE